MTGKTKSYSSTPNELYYRMPESDHEELGHIRDELGMLAHLTMRSCCDREELVQLSIAALSQCFARLSVEITEILDGCLAPSDYEALRNRSRH